jgi:hypothetical protein
MPLFSGWSPPEFQAYCGVLGVAEDGTDYIHPLNQYGFRSLDGAKAAVERDKDYWSDPHKRTFGGLMPDSKGKRTYRIFQAAGNGWQEVHSE